MVQDVIMYIIEILAVIYLVGYMINTVRQAKNEGKCSGCPFASECNIKSKKRINEKRRKWSKVHFNKKKC